MDNNKENSTYAPVPIIEDKVDKNIMKTPLSSEVLLEVMLKMVNLHLVRGGTAKLIHFISFVNDLGFPCLVTTTS